MMSPEDFEQMLKMSYALEKLKERGIIRSFNIIPGDSLANSKVDVQVPEDQVGFFFPDELMPNKTTH